MQSPLQSLDIAIGAVGALPQPGLLPAGVPPASDAEVAQAMLALRKGATLRLLGDDVLLWPGLPSLVGKARAAGAAHVTVQTTALPLLRPGVAAAVKAMGVSGLLVPLFGADAEGHDHLVGRPGAFAATLRGLRAARAADLRLEIFAVALRPTMRSLDALVARALPLPIDALHVVVPGPGSDAPPAWLPHPALAAPFVVRAMTRAVAARRRVTVRGVPPCRLGEMGALACELAPAPPAIDADSALLAAAIARQFMTQAVDACGDCRWHACCPGVSVRQVERFGATGIVARKDAPPRGGLAAPRRPRLNSRVAIADVSLGSRS